MPNQLEQLLDSIPLEYKGEVLEVIFAALAPRLQDATDAIEAMPDYYNPDLLPDSALPWALELVGWPVAQFWGAYAQRQILKKIPQWRRDYAKTGVLEDIVATYFKSGSAVNPLVAEFTVRKQTTGGFRVGVSRVGKGHIWQGFNRFNIRVRVTSLGTYTYGEWTSQLQQRLVALVEEMLPARMLYQIERAFPIPRAFQGKNEYSGNNNTVPVTVPSGSVAGDMLVVAMLVGGGAGVANPPAGWTKHTETVVSNQKLCFFSRVMQSGDTTWNFPITASLWFAAVIANYRVAETFISEASGTSASPSGSITIGDGALHILGIMSASNTPTASGFTQRAQFAHPGGTFISLWDKTANPPSSTYILGNADAWQNALLV